MDLPFVKLEGAGNDFVLIDRVARSIELDPALARQLCDRRFGIGADQILLIDGGRQERFAYAIYNADGSQAGQCGNGARCIALYLRRRYGLPARFAIESPAGRVEVDATDPNYPEVSLGVPSFDADAIPTTRPNGPAGWPLRLWDTDYTASALSIGNPHVVVEVADAAKAPLAELAALLQIDPAFPDSCNVGVAQIIDREHIKLRVAERGVGETLACGSGACAAAVALISRDRVESAVALQLPGGELRVRWAGPGKPVLLAGPARWVFEGSLQP
jgi:diaminopimelate epimerase